MLDPTNDPVEIETNLKYIAQELANKLKAYEMAGSCIGVIYKIGNKPKTKNESLNRFISK
ncbi:MAG: hypothetical protein MJ223_03795 [Mycoplasmoidaceae bacterium]|nr:hypothetical protein [Mycoplasmoidaceae bacterium]